VQRYYRKHVWTIEGYAASANARITSMQPIPAMRVTPSSTRMSGPTNTSNIRNADPASYCICTGVSDSVIYTSIECAAAGYAFAVTSTETISARM
jgi:hypothetical protein